MKIPPIATNLIGSFPLKDTPDNFRRAIDEQVTAGLDYISYPQLADMTLMFLEPLVDGNSVRQDGQKFIVNKEFEPVLTKEVRRWSEDAYNRVRQKKGIIPLKSCVTGPFTLASNLQVEGFESRPFPMGYVELMVEHPWVLEKLVRYVRKVCRVYSDFSSIVSIDEPFLSIFVGKRKNLLELAMSRGEAFDFVVEMLDKALQGIRTIPSIHVCGGIGRCLSEILLETDFKILSHEFSVMTRNFESYAPADPESYSKILSVGVVTTAPTEDPEGVEPIVLVEKRMKNAIKRYGMENVVFSPDCGFRPLGDLLGEEEGHKLAMSKIESLVRAKSNLASRLDLLTEKKK